MDATAIRLHHIDPGHEPVRQEIAARLGRVVFVPAIANDPARRALDERRGLRRLTG